VWYEAEKLLARTKLELRKSLSLPGSTLAQLQIKVTSRSLRVFVHPVNQQALRPVLRRDLWTLTLNLHEFVNRRLLNCQCMYTSLLAAELLDLPLHLTV
jgi:hypothetical protein